MVTAPLAEHVLDRLHQIVASWCRAGATFINLPWVVPGQFVEWTCPAGRQHRRLPTPHGCLVASGEQSFLALHHATPFPMSRRFIGWTPCFRSEPEFDAIHHFYFMKAEVFELLPDGICPGAAVIALRDEAARHLASLLPPGKKLSFQQTDEAAWDIELAGMEVGSYGWRHLPAPATSPSRYLYATALAEPRFSQALAQALS